MHAVTLFYMLNLMNSLLNNLVKKFADFQINLRAKHFVKHILVLSLIVWCDLNFSLFFTKLRKLKRIHWVLGWSSRPRLASLKKLYFTYQFVDSCVPLFERLGPITKHTVPSHANDNIILAFLIVTLLDLI